MSATLYARAALGSLTKRGTPRPLADHRADTELDVDRAHLARYARVCGFGVADELPLTYPHVLAFELQLRLLAESPFPVLGLVHLANRFEQRRALDAAEHLSLSVRTGAETEHPRGRAFIVLTDVTVAGEPVWHGESTYLYRTGGSPRGGSRRGGAPAEQHTPPGAVWRLGADLGRRYAAVSGDRNPIHLHRLTARPFGFRRPIAHGMWTAARCVAALGRRAGGACSVEVSFGRPLYLPSTVEFRADAGGGFAVHSSRGQHLRGQLSRIMEP